MPLNLTLTATLSQKLSPPAARDWLARAAVWFEAVGDAVLDAHVDRDAEGRSHLRILCHPAAQPVDVKLRHGENLKLIARTSPAGPGYHAFLCKLLGQFAADFDFMWDEPPGDHDPGRFFVHGDFAKLETLFQHWLSSRCQQMLTNHPGGPHNLGLPNGVHYLHPGSVLTPLGPRSLEWLKAVAAEESAGTDFFSWREPGLTPAFYRGRALCRLWLDFPGRAPLTDEEGELVDQIAADFANAFDMDDTLDLPWAAWLEVMDAIAADEGRFTVEPIAPELRALVAERANGVVDLIGYRRHPVRVPLAGDWRIDIPGHFAARWDDDGRTWSAWDGPRTVWFRDLAVSENAADALAVSRGNLPRGEHFTTNLHRTVLGEAVFGPHDENGQPMHRLSGLAATDGHLAACNIYVKDLADKDWAITTWQSLRQE